jgi:uncharacterized protein
MRTNKAEFFRFGFDAAQSNGQLGRLLIFIICSIAALCLSECPGSTREGNVENTPEQAIAALRDAYSAFNRGDIDAAVEGLDAQIEWTEPLEFPGGGTYHGRDGVKQYLTQSRAAWAELNSQPERFITVADRIVVFVHARVRPKASNEWHDVRLADVYTMRGGKIVEMRAFADRQDALHWAGVETPTP